MTRAAAVLALTLALATSAHAQRRAPRPVAAPSAEDDARRLFFVGAELFQEGDYEAALTSWQSSYELRPAHVVKYNIALALRELFRYAEAAELLREYLRDDPSLAASRRASIQRAINLLEARIAPITLDVRPAGARVRIDGRDVGTAPLAEPLQLSAGRRRLEIEADGHVSLREEIAVAGGRARTLRLRLARRDESGHVRIASTMPPDADVRIDGLDVGRAPVTRELPRGGHVIEARAAGHVLYRAPVQLATNQELDLRVVMDPERVHTILDEWWFWTAIGLAVAGGVVGVVLATQPQEPPPVPGNGFQGVIEVLLER